MSLSAARLALTLAALWATLPAAAQGSAGWDALIGWDEAAGGSPARMVASIQVVRIPPGQRPFPYEGTVLLERADRREGGTPRLYWELAERGEPVERLWADRERVLLVDERERAFRIREWASVADWEEATFLLLGPDPSLREHFEAEVLHHSPAPEVEPGETPAADLTAILRPASAVARRRFREVVLQMSRSAGVVVHATLTERSDRLVWFEISSPRAADPDPRLSPPSEESLRRDGYRPW